MLGKAAGLAADEVFLDLEDSVAPAAKEAARANVVAALRDGTWRAGTRAVRVNDVTTSWSYADVIAVVEGAGSHLDCLILPKVTSGHDVRWLDTLLAQLERAGGLPVGRIGVEAQIESAAGLAHVEEIAAASARLEALVYGPADFMASIGVRALAVGAQPAGYEGADAYHYVLARILVAARANGLQAIDGPYVAVHDLDGFRRRARRTAALGYDGTWVVHPGQIDVANDVYAPTQADFDRAEAILDAYARSTSAAGGLVGAVLLGDEMIDEASRKMALVVAGKGRAAGLSRGGIGLEAG